MKIKRSESVPAGLRERKKQRTRRAISDVATRLFIKRGFDRVTMAEVAEASEVSVNTVFNYFRTKEELFFDRADEVTAQTGEIVKNRPPGESVVDALHRAHRTAAQSHPRFFAAEKIRPFMAAIEASPSLERYAQHLMVRSEERLLEALFNDRGLSADQATIALVAALITGLQRRLLQEYQMRLRRGDSDAKLRSALIRAIDHGFALLRNGLGDYGKTGKVTEGPSTGIGLNAPGKRGVRGQSLRRDSPRRKRSTPA